MSKPPRKSVRTAKTPREGHASDHDDASLWSHVAHTVTSVRKKARVLEVEVLPQSSRAERPTDPLKPPMPERKPTDRVAAMPKHPAAKVTPPLADFDRRTAKKIGKGAIDIEARIDLHGQRLDDAYVALRRFLFRCHTDDKRMVLVVTGKGRETSDPYADFDMGSERGRRGVIRQSVPRWLEEPDLRAIVVSHTTASPRHGGDGALYVRLRKGK